MRTKTPDGKMILSQKEVQTLQRLVGNQSLLLSRSQLMTGLGQTYEGARDLYAVLGYKKEPLYQDFYNLFIRQDIATRIVKAFPLATWRGLPEVYETEDPDDVTPFEEAWKDLVNTINIWHFMNRTDQLAGIGRYAVLFLGFNDNEKDLSKPVKPKTEGMKLLYMQPYSETNAQINTWCQDRSNPRYGPPETYQLQICTEVGMVDNVSIGSLVVHHSRVIHVADGLVESNVFGTPRLQNVLNRLVDLERVVGGSGEMFWRGAFPGLGLEMDANAKIDNEQALEDEIDEYTHNLRRVLRLKGIKVNPLSPEVADPSSHVNVQMQLISGATQIPMRILIGSERGELSSAQDQEAWEERVDERRRSFAEPIMVRPFINKLIEFKVLPDPEQDITIDWPDVGALSEKDQAAIGLVRAQSIQAYVTSGASSIIPPMTFLTSILRYSEAEANYILSDLEKRMKEENPVGAPPPPPAAPAPGPAPGEAGKQPNEGMTSKEGSPNTPKAKLSGPGEPAVLGGSGSGNFGHEGRPGEIGGSGEGGGGINPQPSSSDIKAVRKKAFEELTNPVGKKHDR